LAVAAFGLAVVLYPVALMVCFGKTGYARPVDAIVVFGAGVTPGGAPSLALHDRVMTSVRLKGKGLAPLLIFSGGPGPGAVSETDAMRRLALEAGVADERILLDPAGVNTRATVANTIALFRNRHIRRALAVSHFYHLPRVKMAYQRAGFDVFTEPAQESRALLYMPWYMTREAAAFWAYYLGVK